MKCTVCQRSFEIKKYLDQHMKIHDPEKKFQCSKCPKRFHRKANKNHHEKIHLRRPGAPRALKDIPLERVPVRQSDV